MSMEWSLAAALDVHRRRRARPRHAGLEGHAADLRGGRGADAKLRRVPRSATASASAASATSSSGGSAARRPSPCSSTTAPSTSSRCWAASARGPCPSTSTSTTGPRRSAACSTWWAPRPSSTTARSVRWSARRRAGVDRSARRRRRRIGSLAARRQHELRGRRRRRAPAPRTCRSRLPTISTSSVREARPAHRRACSGARATSSSPRWAAPTAPPGRASTAKAAAGGGTWFAAPPLMHAAAQWTAFAGIHSGGTIVLHDDAAPFDARTILETVARERVNLMSIVGDAFARRLIEELRTASLRPRLAADHRDGRSRHERGLQGGAARAAPPRHHRRRLRRIGDRRDGLRCDGTRGPVARLRARGGRRGSLGGSPSIPRAGRRRDRLDGAARARAARLPRRPERRPRRRSRSSTASASPSPAIGPGSRRTARSSCSGATRWS